MTKLPLPLPLVVGIAAATVALLYFRHEQRAQLDRLKAATGALEETAARAEDAEQRSEKFKRALLNLQAEQLLQAAGPAPANNRARSAPPEESPAAKLFHDPELRATMRKEHLHGMERTVSQIVDSNLVQLLNLTPEQAGALKDLVRKKHTPGVDLVMGLMSADASELPAIGHTAQRDRNQADAEIRSFLGEDAYHTYKTYEDSLQERLQLARMRRGSEQTALALTPEQEAGLLQAMIEERRNFPFTHDLNDPLNLDMDRLPEIFGEASLNQLMNEMDQLNNRIILRAQTLLDPQQSGAFAQAIRDHFEKSRMTVKMTQALFPVGGRRAP